MRFATEIAQRVINSAENYGKSGAEEVAGQSIAGALRAGTVPRHQSFIVSMVCTHKARRAGLAAAGGRSVIRLRLNCVDLNRLRCPGPHRLRETLNGFETLMAKSRRLATPRRKLPPAVR